MIRLSLLLTFLLISSPSFSQNGLIAPKGKQFVYRGESGMFRTKYESIRNFSEGRAAVKQNGKWGFIDEKGILITPCRYDSVLDFHVGMARVALGGQALKWGLINAKGQGKCELHYDSIVYLDSFALAYRKSTANPTRVICHVYHCTAYISDRHEALSFERIGENYMLNLATPASGKCKYFKLILDHSGREVTPEIGVRDSVLHFPCPVWKCSWGDGAILKEDLSTSKWYSGFHEYDDGFYSFSENGKNGVVNRNGKEIIAAEHKFISKVGPAFISSTEKKYTLWDTTGRRLTPECYIVQHLGQGVYRCKVDSVAPYQLFKANGELIPGKFSEAHFFHSSVARVVSEDQTQFGYIDSTGRMIGGWYPRRVNYYSNTAQIGNTTIHYVRALTYQSINEKGEIVTDSIVKRELKPYNSSFTGLDFENGYGIYTVAQKRPSPNPHGEEPALLGVIDSTGKIVAKALYYSITIEDTFIVVFSTDAKRGLRCPCGVQLLPAVYDGFIDYIGNGFFKVQREDFGDYAIYNARERKFVTKFIYDDVDLGGDSMSIVTYKSLKGYVNYNGTQIAPMNFRSAGEFKDGRAKVNPGYLPKEEFYIDSKGKRIE